jgi:hypothetical protein
MWLSLGSSMTISFAKFIDEFPADYESSNWHKYNNPIEVKFANDHFSTFGDNIQKIFALLSTSLAIKKFAEISGIPDLEFDPHLHGAGLHAHPRNGRLNLHLDYEKHPITGKQRGLNTILYLSKDWKSEWNGQTELWDPDVKPCIASSPVVFNTAIIFQTNEISWHGLPEKIKCPEGTFRKTLAYYYVSPLIAERSTGKHGANEDGFRTKASFIKRPRDDEDARMEKLYAIRMHRRISTEDLDEIWPGWNAEEF